jgi:DnaJ family protein C protein 3
MLVSLRYLSIFLACIGGGYGSQSPDIPPDTPLASLISTAKSHLAKGSPRDALLYFDTAVSRDPTNYLTIFQRGATYLSLGKDAQASQDFDRVLQLKPGFEGALLQRARIKTRSGDWAGAKQDLDVAGKKSSIEYEELEQAQTAARTADEAEKKGDWEACVLHAGTAIMKANMAVHLRQLRLQCRLQRGDVQEAISDLGHVLQLSPGSVEPHLQISSMLFYSLGDTHRGIAQIRKCLHSDPDSKTCGHLFKREKQALKRLDQLSDFIEKRKFTNAANLMVGVDGDDGLIGDIIRDVKEAKDAGYIHPAAPNYLHNSLIERICEAYRGVSDSKAIRILS